MAITYVNSAIANYETAVSTFSVSIPSGFTVGDLALIQITTASSAQTTFTPPAGSVELLPVTVADASRSQAWYVFPSSTATLSVGLSNAQQGTLVAIFLAGVNMDTPLASAVSASAITGNINAVAGSVNTTTADAYICGGLVQGSGSASWAPPAGWTIRADGSRRNGILGTKGIQSEPGPVGEAAWVMSDFNAAHRAWQVALFPASFEPSVPPLVATLVSEGYSGFSGDVADGASIILDSTNPGNSVVICTNKDAGGGLYVLDMDGEIVSSVLDGAANSSDWREPAGSGWDGRVLVLTVDRDDNLIRYYWYSRTTRTLASAGSTSVAYEPYGSCLYVHSNGSVYAFISDRGDDDFGTHIVRQYLLTRSGNTVSAGSAVRSISEDGVMEGMCADDITGGLFVSREDHGLYRYSAAPSGGTTYTTVDEVGDGNLVADVEDVAVARTSEGAWLLVSSQGDSSYHVYDLTTFEHEQRFTVARPDGITRVTDTDGLDVLLTPLGSSFPNGVIVVHDGSASPISNFNFVDAGLVFGELPEEVEPPAFANVTYWNGVEETPLAGASVWDGSSEVSLESISHISS